MAAERKSVKAAKGSRRKVSQLPIGLLGEPAMPLQDCRVVGGGMCECVSSERVVLSGRREHLLLYTVSGQGFVQCEGAAVHVVSGSFLLMPFAGKAMCTVKKSLWRFVWFRLDASGRWGGVYADTKLVRKAFSVETIACAARGYLRERGTGEHLADEAAAAYAVLLSTSIKRDMACFLRAPVDEWAERLKSLWRLVGEDLRKDWRVPQLAEKLGVSVAHFYRILAAHEGRTPWQIVTLIRMRRAQEMLAETDSPLHVIAEALGYDNEFALSTVFKRWIGCNPSEYRKKMR